MKQAKKGPKPKKPSGPKAEVLKLEGPREDRVRESFKKGAPPRNLGKGKL